MPNENSNTVEETEARDEQLRRAFEKLMREEDRTLTPGIRPQDRRICHSGGAADEPWVAFTTDDRVGLALSGGGIRSATFNLGLLQGFCNKKLLERIDYLSTVSGGGYIGGFWTAWLKRVRANSPDIPLFPIGSEKDPRSLEELGKASPDVKDFREPNEIRHLREFSRFLMPRLGFFKEEMWSGVVAVLSAMIPALILALGLVGAIISLWGTIASTVLHFPSHAWLVPATVTIATWIVYTWREWTWQRCGKAGPGERGVGWFILFALMSIVALLAAWHFGHAWFFSRTGSPEYRETFGPARAGAWMDYWKPNARLFAPALLWLAAAAPVLFIRICLLRFYPKAKHIESVAAADRVLMRLMASALVWLVVCLEWECAVAMFYWEQWAAPALGGGVVGTSAVFVWLRKWLAAQPSKARAEGLMTRLKPILPQVAANIAVFLIVVLVAHLLIKTAPLTTTRGWPYCVAFWTGAILVLLLVSLVGLNPLKVGLHDFYRSRICRAYLGAALPDKNTYAPTATPAADNRMTTETERDDVDLPEWQDGIRRGLEQPVRPIHLVCCTANNLSADRLATLYRGARSAVVSVNGISVGGRVVKPSEMQLSSALTASAAAFNSNMGSISTRLGPAVTFLLSALNLRLGLWVPNPLWHFEKRQQRVERRTKQMKQSWEKRHPGQSKETETDDDTTQFRERIQNRRRSAGEFVRKAWSDAGELAVEAPDIVYEHIYDKLKWNERKPSFPGIFFFKELFGRTNCDDKSRYIHLSDGGHFENLALYELVRRHCRYIIVSDCGADPDVGFDDFGNAVRRIREDFGVEIEIDLSPLRPGADGISKQHMAVGTVHYNGNGNDKGTLLYYKPSLTGDEPGDITQYRKRNSAFPHESTGDQFYDEAQWEAYRRLGEHAANDSLRFMESSEGEMPTSEIFRQARMQWYPPLPDYDTNFLQLTERCSLLEGEIREHAPACLRAEFFPEVATSMGLSPAAPNAAQKDQEALRQTAADNEKVVYYMLQVAQVMEDAWLACHLERHWAHPMNQGWMNYMQRWASTPSFRRWWPILKPIYGEPFRRFADVRFGLKKIALKFDLRCHSSADAEIISGIAWRQYCARNDLPPLNRQASMYACNLTLLDPIAPLVKPQPMQVGLAFISWRTQSVNGTPKKIAEWNSHEFFVPSAFTGAGITTRFLGDLCEKLNASGAQRVAVILTDEDPHETADGNVKRTDLAHRQVRTDLITFYKGNKFRYAGPNDIMPDQKLGDVLIRDFETSGLGPN